MSAFQSVHTCSRFPASLESLIFKCNFNEKANQSSEFPPKTPAGTASGGMWNKPLQGPPSSEGATRAPAPGDGTAAGPAGMLGREGGTQEGLGRRAAR